MDNPSKTPMKTIAPSDSFSPPAHGGEPVIRAVSISKRFSGEGLSVDVLRAANLEVRAGESVSIVGSSGSGKSTLLHILGGLDLPTEGQAWLAGREISRMPPAEQGAWRNLHLGFVYQFHHLLPEFSALDNVAMPLRIRRMSTSASRDMAREALRSVGLAHRAEHRPSQLSGGERQRVAIARAIAARPACVIADEPTGNLDRDSADGVFDILASLPRGQGMALLLVTHDESLARRCDRLLRMDRGSLA